MLMESPALLLLLGLLGKFGAAGAFDGVCIFATELFPTQVRSVAMGTASTSARMGVLVAQPLIAIGQSSDAGWLPLLAFGLTCGLAACLALKLPETLNQPMWETIAQTLAAQEGTLRLEEADVSDIIAGMDQELVSLAQVRSVLGDEAVAKLAEERSDLE
eukprot:TRINITY_DN20539_c0_g1_i1.p2 TRINITY_DN20539_c0_g1~~TRINITY_DN20539_c0_g1_i1.p2  ORF type:complete len:160 (-),score=47.54 TRINITY_DN20539_c0_g1_i1:106-585(-)